MPGRRGRKEEEVVAESMDEDEEEEEIYEVEAILGKRVRGGETEYQVKWKGYQKKSDNTW